MMKETFTKEEVVEMLKQMQIETAECQSFIVGTVSQAWVIEDLLGKKIKKLGGKGITVVYK